MKKGLAPFIVLLFAPVWLSAQPTGKIVQQAKIDGRDFFTDDRPLEVLLSTDLRSLASSRKNPVYQNAALTCRFPDSSVIHEQIRVKRRGKFRNENCYLASLTLDFKNLTSPLLAPLKKLKWVGGCDKGANQEQLLLKEYLIYRIYNLLTPMSFRVRLLKATYQDNRVKVKTYTQYAFLLEDMDALAKRNHCRQKEVKRFHDRSTNRKQMTLVAIFQYMIGNTDWAVSVYHNMKLMVPLQDTLASPYPVPYDFDYTGFVDAAYAVPAETLGIRSVRERVYRGFHRHLPEIEAAAALFVQNEADIISLINNFGLLTPRSKKQVIYFLNDFFAIIKNKRDLKRIFVDNARTE
jgi:hypothetical protein